MNFNYRLIKDSEYQFLYEMLYEALFVPEGQPKFDRSIIENPDIKKYVEKWNQFNHDLAIVVEKDNELIAAIWGRKFTEAKRGYGFVDKNTPEISMAVKEAYRNKGIGTRLINQIEQEYLGISVKALSLSVDKLNSAIKLYEKCGYNIYQEQETAITMMKKLKASAEK